MWLGFAAAFAGMLYALLRFLTMLRLRRWREELQQVNHETRKVSQRVGFLRGKLEAQQSRRRALQRQVAETRRIAQHLSARLQAGLPPGVRPQLERCRSLSAEPANREVRLVRELSLMDEVSRALGAFSLLVLELPRPPDTDQTLAVAGLTQRLATSGMRFHGPEDGRLLVVCRTPAEALGAVQSLLPGLSAATAAAVRGAVRTGMEVGGEEEDLRRMLVRSLRQTRELLEQAPAGGLLLNQAAYQALGAPEEVRLVDAEGEIYAFTWAESLSGRSAVGRAAGPAAEPREGLKGPTSPKGPASSATGWPTPAEPKDE